MPIKHPAERALSCDWSVNSFVMVVFEKFLVVLWTKNFDQCFF